MVYKGKDHAIYWTLRQKQTMENVLYVWLTLPPTKAHSMPSYLQPSTCAKSYRQLCKYQRRYN